MHGRARWTWPIVLLLALASSGCVTTSPQALAVASGEEKELAVIAVDARVAGSPPSRCGAPMLWMQRYVDNKLTGLHLATGSANHIFGGMIAPSTIPLEPGTYGVVRVEIKCGNRNQIIHTKSKGFLIPEYEQTIVTFDVAAGEVVNLGTLNLGKPILGKIGPANSHVGPLEDDVWRAFIEANPEIAKKMRFRPMELRSPEMPRPPTARF